MAKTNQCITGSGNIQVAGNYITNSSIFTNSIEIICNCDLPITNEEAKTIKDKILLIRENGYKISLKKFNEKFDVTSYKNLPRNKFDEAIQWLENHAQQSIPEQLQTLRCMEQK